MPLSDWKELSQEEEKERTEGGRRTSSLVQGVSLLKPTRKRLLLTS
jgi:hypothetical protein